MGALFRYWLLLASLAVSPAPESTEVNRIFAELSATTGFPIRHQVKFQVLSRSEVNRFLEDRIRQAVKPAELRAEELTLKKLGFVPADFDLQKTTVALLTEQTAAFYDYRRKQLFLTDWASTSLRDAAIVHEMAHALADQNYNLERFARKVQNDTEKSAARQAVVEGQASWLMRELGRLHPEQKGSAQDDTLFPVFDQAPLYLRETLTFPYNHGTDFQQAVFAKFGKDSFRKVFVQPPVSTQQILHPEVYFAGTKPVSVPLPSVRGMHRFVEGPLGELEHSILLRQWTTEADARDLSPSWRGGRYQLWENRKTGRVSLVYGSAWDTAADASRFFGLYVQLLRKKLHGFQISDESDTLCAGKSSDGYFDLQRKGEMVISREGFAERP